MYTKFKQAKIFFDCYKKEDRKSCSVKKNN